MNDFTFKQFSIKQSLCSQKVSTDACILGAWVTERMGAPKTVLDIGAGTGLLMLMIAQRSDASIDGIEIEEICFKQLTENLSASPFSSRVHAMKGDVREQIFLNNYDLIVSNPPFYENQLIAEKEEKKLAWHSSMLRLEELLDAVKNTLSSAGKFAIILPFSRTEEAKRTASRLGLFMNQKALIRHSSKHAFTRTLMLFSFSEETIHEEIIDIKNEAGQYSDRMIELLDDYYLSIKG